jgi:hypothetical protein
LRASIQPFVWLAKRTETADIGEGAPPTVTGGAGTELQDRPPSVVRAIDKHAPEEQGTVPAAQPSKADTNVTAWGVNPAGTGVAGGMAAGGRCDVGRIVGAVVTAGLD